jgi:hypothetical protein
MNPKMLWTKHRYLEPVLEKSGSGAGSVLSIFTTSTNIQAKVTTTQEICKFNICGYYLLFNTYAFFVSIFFHKIDEDDFVYAICLSVIQIMYSANMVWDVFYSAAWVVRGKSFLIFVKYIQI